ncbi:hypothetical protein ACFXTH_032513 [Malus domestica]
MDGCPWHRAMMLGPLAPHVGPAGLSPQPPAPSLQLLSPIQDKLKSCCEISKGQVQPQSKNTTISSVSALPLDQLLNSKLKDGEVAF